MRVSVVLEPKHYEALGKLARQEYRKPPEQAAYLIARAVEAAGQGQAPSKREE